MNKTLLLAVSSFVAMLVFDAGWLAVMSKRFYAPLIGHLMAKSPSLVPAAVFYLLYITGLTILVLVPSVEQKRELMQVFLFGALFGLVAYGTYDLTNQATLKDWPFVVTLVDLVWGALLTGVVSVISVAITRRFM